MVHKEIEEILQVSIPFAPIFFLKCWVKESACMKHKYLLLSLITAASTLLALYWKNNLVPSKQEWKAKLCHICLMSKLSAFRRSRSGSLDAFEKFNIHW